MSQDLALKQRLLSAIIYSVITKQTETKELFPTKSTILQILEKKQDKNLEWIKDVLYEITKDNSTDTYLCVLLGKHNLTHLMNQEFIPERISTLVYDYYKVVSANPTGDIIITRKHNPDKAREKLPSFLSKYRKSSTPLMDLQFFINSYGLAYDKKRRPNGIKAYVWENRSVSNVLEDLCEYLGCRELADSLK